ncbi:MAG: mechanosensitive ion channel family protein [Mariprofundaceae bacterium]|nr:mechanosensitive ion channel family protein [Mariprofundaceae bacterium]
MDIINHVLHWTFLEVPVSRYLLAMMMVLLTVLAQRYLIGHLHKMTHRLAEKTHTHWDDIFFHAAEKPANGLILVVGVTFSIQMLDIPKDIFSILNHVNDVSRILTIALAMWFIWRFLDGLLAYFSDPDIHTDTILDNQLIPVLFKTLKIFLVMTAVLMLAQNMGYSISGLIASLGIGGIAVAMAAKDTISNIFGSMMILVDQPFKIGDWVKTSEFEGVVEEIGFRSTRIRTFGKTLVNVPNSQLANMVIENMDARSKRRVKMRIGITYSASPEQIQQAVSAIEKILREHHGVDQSYSLVKFDTFEDSSLSIFLYYFSQSTVWEEYLQVRQEVNIQIMQAIENLGLEFAFPSMSLYHENLNV